ncbi:hypothetical protein U1Q18_008529 [Sarracenia purpurea var. burkii]
MSTPPVLSNSTKTCSGYRPECIGDTQKALFYTALPLIAVGISGHRVSLESFITEQTENYNVGDGIGIKGKVPWQIIGTFGVLLVPIIAGIALPYIKPWSIRFGIPAICTLVATLMFLSGSCSYKYNRPRGSPITTVFRVFVAFFCKISQRLPTDANELYEKDDADIQFLPHTHSLRCLDKAAIILATRGKEEQEARRWTLCRITEVEETKDCVRLFPMWTTLIACGMVTSVANTFFLEQANHMNRKVGSLKFPLTIFLMAYDFAKSQFAKLNFSLPKRLGGSGLKQHVPATGIAVAMIFSVLTCIAAAKVETRRLEVIQKHGLVDKPEEIIPMSMFWLVPQYLLLAAFDGIAENSIRCLFKDQAPSSMEKYLMLFTKGVFGLGTIGSVISVFVVGKIKPSWFRETLNMSRLDNYYWILTALSAANLVFYILVASLYSYRESASDTGDAPEVGGAVGQYQEGSSQDCCCFC